MELLVVQLPDVPVMQSLSLTYLYSFRYSKCCISHELSYLTWIADKATVWLLYLKKKKMKVKPRCPKLITSIISQLQLLNVLYRAAPELMQKEKWAGVCGKVRSNSVFPHTRALLIIIKAIFQSSGLADCVISLELLIYPSFINSIALTEVCSQCSSERDNSEVLNMRSFIGYSERRSWWGLAN